MTAPGMMQRTQNVGAASFDAKLFVTIAMPAVMAFVLSATPLSAVI